MEFVNPIFNYFTKNIVLYISIQRFYVTSTQNILTVHCVSIQFIKSKESFRICLIKAKVDSIITCNICETTLVGNRVLLQFVCLQ